MDRTPEHTEEYRAKAGDYLSENDLAKVMELVCKNAPQAALKEVDTTCQKTFEKYGISCCQTADQPTCQTKLVDMFEIALVNGLSWDSKMTEWAVMNGFVEILKLVKSNGCTVDLKEVGSDAIKHDKMDVLEWAILSGYEMDDGTKILAKQRWSAFF
jgi:hypothetical protein